MDVCMKYFRKGTPTLPKTFITFWYPTEAEKAQGFNGWKHHRTEKGAMRRKAEFVLYPASFIGPLPVAGYSAC